MIDKGDILLHYKRKDIQEAMVFSSKGKEVSIRYANGGFGKRPDIVQYPNDILEMAKSGASSFHVSEERWANPLMLSTDLKKSELENLRVGWDLLIDIDCPVFEYSRIIAHLIVKALRRYGINAISCKFSGNKGFHIAVPYESFPDKVSIKGELKDIRFLFPEGLRRILNFLGKQIDSKERGYELSSMVLNTDPITVIAEKMNKKPEEMFKTICKKCESQYNKEYRNFDLNMVCPYCQTENKVTEGTIDFVTCQSCNKILKIEEQSKEDICPKCKGKDFIQKFDSSIVLELDTVLISSRHLYRMVYSLHEKSGLASVPIDIDKILEFEKKDADPKQIVINDLVFLDTSKAIPNEARKLIQEAFDDEPLIEVEEIDLNKEYEIPKSAIPQELFPPCMQRILGTQMKDGKKRALFSLINFLDCLGWEYKDIKMFTNKWNNANDDPMREVYVNGQLNAYKAKKKHMLPHNCRSYYEDLQICFPDALCNKIKNPVNYSLIKVWIKSKEEERKKQNLPNADNPNLSEKQIEFIKKRKEEEKLFKQKMKEKKEK